MEGRVEIGDRIRQSRVIAFALISGVTIFATVASFLITKGLSSAPSALSPLAFVAIVVAVCAAAFVAAPLMRRRTEAATPAGASADQVAAAWQSAWMIAQALKEGAGLFGVVMGLNTGSIPLVVGAAAVSVSAQLMSLPREDELRDRLRAANV